MASLINLKNSYRQKYLQWDVGVPGTQTHISLNRFKIADHKKFDAVL